MTIDKLTVSQREPSYGEIAWADDIVSDEYIEEEFAGVNFVEEDFRN